MSDKDQKIRNQAVEIANLKIKLVKEEEKAELNLLRKFREMMREALEEIDNDIERQERDLKTEGVPGFNKYQHELRDIVKDGTGRLTRQCPRTQYMVGSGVCEKQCAHYAGSSDTQVICWKHGTGAQRR